MPDQKGLTLIEVLVVMVVLALAAVILVPLGLQSGQNKYFEAMKEDLKDLAVAEEIYYADHYTYTSNFQDLDFFPSEGVTLILSNAGEYGWRVTARHSALGPDLGCGLFYGKVDASSMEFLPSAPGDVFCVMR